MSVIQTTSDGLDSESSAALFPILFVLRLVTRQLAKGNVGFVVKLSTELMKDNKALFCQIVGLTAAHVQL